MTSIHQASYFPWQGLVNKIDKSDVFILLDEVQFNDGAYQNRNLFLDKQYNKHMLTMPIEKKHYLQKSIKDILIVDPRWQTKHLKFLMQNYSKHHFYEEILEEIMPIYTNKYTYLIDVLEESILLTLKLFSIDTQVIKQSSINYDERLKKNELIIELLHKTNSKSYLSGIGAKAYQNEVLFKQNNISLLYQNYQQIPYKQFGCSTFVDGLSSLDLLFNIGKDLAKNYI